MPEENLITVEEVDNTTENEIRQSRQQNGDVKDVEEIMEKGTHAQQKVLNVANAEKGVTLLQFVEPEQSMKSPNHQRAATSHTSLVS